MLRIIDVGLCVGFSVGGYFGGYDQIIIARGNYGSALCAVHLPFDIDENDLFIREFSDREWKALMQKLFELLDDYYAEYEAEILLAEAA